MKSMLILAVLCMPFFASEAAGQKSNSTKKGIKNVGEVESIIRQHFQSLPTYQSGDLITTQQVQPLFGKFAAKDWKVPGSDNIMARVTPTGSYLDQQMNSGNGRRFFRDISSYPGGIDRVERMSNIKNGRNSINQLVNKTPRGSDFIKALATSKHGKILGDWTGSSKQINKATEKIYTQEQLIDVLKKLYQQSQQVEKKRRTQR